MTYVAQRKDNGKTVQGFLYAHANVTYIIPPDEYFREEACAGAWRLLNVVAFAVEDDTVEALPW